MKNIIQEYASSVVALVATILFFLVAGTLLFGADGMLAQLIAQIGGSSLQ